VAGTFDLHTVIALKSGWEAMTEAQFKSLFTGFPDTMLASWYTELKAETIRFMAAFALGETELPSVVVRLEDEQNEFQPLGFSTGLDTSSEILEQTLGFMSKETVCIYTFSSNAELMRALYVAMRAIMISSVKWFLSEAGYQSFDFLGGGDIDPERGLFPENLGVLMRLQKWSASSVAKAPNIEYPVQPFVVGWQDFVVDGTDTGGVTGTS
jgi:hypothetical protein